MFWLALFAATAWVDFVVIVLSKFIPMTHALQRWYAELGVVAAFDDVTIIVLGIALAQLIWPGIHGWSLVAAAVLIQVVHDILFYLFVIRLLPLGHNKIIDLFKQYAEEGSWQIILADSAMVASTVFLMEALQNSFNENWIFFIGALGVYSLTYIVHTK